MSTDFKWTMGLIAAAVSLALYSLHAAGAWQ